MTKQRDDRDEYGNSRLHDLISTRPRPTPTANDWFPSIPIVPWGYDPTNALRFT